MKNDNESIFEKKTIMFTIGIILFIIATFYGLLRLHFVDIFGVNNSGELGDTIGGIAGPIINLFGAILVYKSFLSQIKANKIQIENIERDRAFNNLWELYKEIKSDLDNFEYLYVKDNPHSVVLKGSHSFERITYELEYVYKTVISKRKFVINNILAILESISLIYDKIDGSEMTSTDKDLILNKMNNLYTNYLNYYISKFIDLIQDEESNLRINIIEQHKKILSRVI